MVGRPDHAGDDVAILAFTVRIENGHGHDLHAEIRDGGDALHGDRVGVGGDDAGEPRPVAARVGHPVRAVENRGARNHFTGELRVRRVYPGVEERNLGGTRRVDRAEDLIPADLRQGPLVGIERIRRHDRLRLPGLVELDVLNLRISLIARQDRRDIARRYGDDVQAQRGNRGDLDATIPRDDGSLLLGRQAGHQLDEEGRRRGLLGGRRNRKEQGAEDDHQADGNGCPLEHVVPRG